MVSKIMHVPVVRWKLIVLFRLIVEDENRSSSLLRPRQHKLVARHDGEARHEARSRGITGRNG